MPVIMTSSKLGLLWKFSLISIRDKAVVATFLCDKAVVATLLRDVALVAPLLRDAA